MTEKHRFKAIIIFESDLRIDPENPPDLLNEINEALEHEVQVKILDIQVQDLTLYEIRG